MSITGPYRKIPEFSVFFFSRTIMTNREAMVFEVIHIQEAAGLFRRRPGALIMAYVLQIVHQLEELIACRLEPGRFIVRDAEQLQRIVVQSFLDISVMNATGLDLPKCSLKMGRAVVISEVADGDLKEDQSGGIVLVTVQLRFQPGSSRVPETGYESPEAHPIKKQDC
jgi:hypothetical protein